MKQAQPAPRPRGRPPGSKNKPKPPELPLPKSKKMIDDLAKRKKMIDDLPTEPAYEADSLSFLALSDCAKKTGKNLHILSTPAPAPAS